MVTSITMRINYVIVTVAYCCLVTASLLEVWSGLEMNRAVETPNKESVLTKVLWEDDGNSKYVWMTNLGDEYDTVKQKTNLKTLTVLGICLVMVAMVITFKFKNQTGRFISHVFFTFSAICLILASEAYISMRLGPRTEPEVDAAIVMNLKFVGTGIVITAVVLHVLRTTLTFTKKFPMKHDFFRIV